VSVQGSPRGEAPRYEKEENRIADAVGYFVSANPITVTTVPGKDK